jgi:predicted aspartyl protease
MDAIRARKRRAAGLRAQLRPWAFTMQKVREIRFLAVNLLLLVSCVGSVLVPMEPNPRTGHFIVEARYSQKIGSFIIDTGTSLPVVSKHFLIRNQIEAPSRLYIDAVTRTANRNLGSLPADELLVTEAASFSIGLAKFAPGAPFLLLDLAALELALGSEIGGIIGGGILNSATYTIDFAERRLTIMRTEIDRLPPHQVSFHDQVPFVMVNLNGHDVQFMIDTGALQTTIDEDSALRFVDGDKVQPKRRFNILTFQGQSEALLGQAIIDKLVLGDEEFTNLSVLVGTENAIGLDVLASGALTIAAPAGRYSFVQSNDKSTPGQIERY